jgi:hypothetical protein
MQKKAPNPSQGEQSIRPFLFSTGLAFALLGISQAGWTHGALIVCLFVASVAFGALGLFWPVIASRVPSFQALLSVIAKGAVVLFLGFLGAFTLIDTGFRLGWYQSTAEPSAAGEWNSEARLTLIFNSTLENATASVQDGIRYYYWYHFPSLSVDFGSKKISRAPGHVLVFMSLQDPTHTNYSLIRVLGGGVQSELISSHAAGAVVRAIGDLRGRTLEVRFSKSPIPLD